MEFNPRQAISPNERKGRSTCYLYQLNENGWMVIGRHPSHRCLNGSIFGTREPQAHISPDKTVSAEV